MTEAFIIEILDGFTIFNNKGSILLIVMPQNPFADLAAPEGAHSASCFFVKSSNSS
jgi:hypothetical protein